MIHYDTIRSLSILAWPVGLLPLSLSLSLDLGEIIGCSKVAYGTSWNTVSTIDPANLVGTIRDFECGLIVITNVNREGGGIAISQTSATSESDEVPPFLFDLRNRRGLWIESSINIKSIDFLVCGILDQGENDSAIIFLPLYQTIFGNWSHPLLAAWYYQDSAKKWQSTWKNWLLLEE